ncbi:MAG: NBR1-Ig-like domain-containing protein [Anaerolineae bacterium]|nr:NBR1-Ig-like domain-containing protein [Anaerolineae bacterium]
MKIFPKVRISLRKTIPAMLMAFVLSGCGLFGKGGEPTLSSLNQIETQAALTVEAVRTQNAAQVTQALDLPTMMMTATSPAMIGETATPTPTSSVAPSSTPAPQSSCDWAGFVEDVTVPDGTPFAPGATFTKTWRLINQGSCSWTSEYDLVFDSGNRMEGPVSQQLTTKTIGPGETLDVSVKLTAPATPGSHTGYWALRNANDVVFGAVFYVEIKVLGAGTGTVPAETQPAGADLIITDFELIPASPTKGMEVEVKVRVFNQGDTSADLFIVRWWPDDTIGVPGCSWTVNDLEPQHGATLSCIYSGYPAAAASLETVVVADVTEMVAESNENNNRAYLTITVN